MIPIAIVATLRPLASSSHIFITLLNIGLESVFAIIQKNAIRKHSKIISEIFVNIITYLFFFVNILKLFEDPLFQ
jgi:uncharacterized membrane protein YozB (DUF420 family)